MPMKRIFFSAARGRPWLTWLRLPTTRKYNFTDELIGKSLHWPLLLIIFTSEIKERKPFLSRDLQKATSRVGNGKLKDGQDTPAYHIEDILIDGKKNSFLQDSNTQFSIYSGEG